MTVILKASETKSYAQKQPHLPHTVVFKGKEHALPLEMASRIVELGGGEIISEVECEVDDSVNPESKEGNQSKVEPETKENPQKQGIKDKFFGKGKRKAGEKRN